MDLKKELIKNILEVINSDASNSVNEAKKQNSEEMVKIFFDTEFTGLHQNTTLISIGLVSYDGKRFYAELSDYDKTQVDDWVERNVISILQFTKEKDGYINDKNEDKIELKGDSKFVAKELTKWLKQFGKVEMWSDCLSYDWVLFNELFGGAMKIPNNVYYIPFDICTLFKERGIDPDISREEFAGLKSKKGKHNSMFDADSILLCYRNLMEIDIKK